MEANSPGRQLCAYSRIGSVHSPSAIPFVIMILEGIVTTLDPAGAVNVAPMGPVIPDDVESAFETFTLRPFRTSQTYRNLKHRPEGVFHVVDDVLLLAKAAVGRLAVGPETSPANTVAGAVLQSACRWYEFRIEEFDDARDRTRLEARVVDSGRLRDHVGFNRARHAVVEAAILATRVHLIPGDEIRSRFDQFATIVQKTAGPREREAFALLNDYINEMLPTTRTVTVKTGSRLHLGILSWKPESGPNFGGIGLMIDRPGAEISVQPIADRDVLRNDQDAAPGQDVVVAPEPQREWLAGLAARFRSQDGDRTPHCRIELRRSIPPHVGLGSGTQTALALAAALDRVGGGSELQTVDLSMRMGRARRSAVGTHGFERGGFILDAGKTDASRPGELAAAVPFPSDWRILLVIPTGVAGLSGTRERDEFRRLPPMTAEKAQELRKLAADEILQSLRESSFEDFTRSVYRFGHAVGEYFAPSQGGVYCGPETTRIVEELRSRGVEGVGQSSWGPTVYAFFENQRNAEAAAEILGGAANLPPSRVMIGRALNEGCAAVRTVDGIYGSV